MSQVTLGPSAGKCGARIKHSGRVALAEGLEEKRASRVWGEGMILWHMAGATRDWRCKV